MKLVKKGGNIQRLFAGEGVLCLVSQPDGEFSLMFYDSKEESGEVPHPEVHRWECVSSKILVPAVEVLERANEGGKPLENAVSGIGRLAEKLARADDKNLMGTGILQLAHADDGSLEFRYHATSLPETEVAQMGGDVACSWGDLSAQVLPFAQRILDETPILDKYAQAHVIERVNELLEVDDGE